MINKSQIVHDLALIHAKQKYEEFFNSVSPNARKFPIDTSELVNFYTAGVAAISNHLEEIEQAYKDDDGEPIFSFK